MAYDELLADRIRQYFTEKNVEFYEKRMMGGLTFMVDDKMCVGIHKERLMARLDPLVYEKVLEKPGANRMEFTGREMKGFVFIDPEGLDDHDQLQFWIDLALDYNPKARSSKSKKNRNE